MFRSFMILPVITILSGCAAFAPDDVADPSTLTIDNAMESIGEGFKKMKVKLDGNRLGIWPCKVTTTLNVTASAEEKLKLVLDTSIKPPADVVTAEIKAKAEKENNSSAGRGNAIIIEFYSAACIPKETLGYDKPEKVQDVVNGLKSSLEEAPYDPILNPISNQPAIHH